MSERNSAISTSSSPPPSSCPKTLADSLNIFLRNKQLFLSIYTLIALPLSFLSFCLSFTSFPTKARILHLEYLAALCPTRFEAKQVWQESRDFAVSLLHLKLLYFFPIYVLSLIAAVSSVVSAHHLYTHHSPPIYLKTVFSSLKSIWVRPFVTSICIYALLCLYFTVPAVLAPMIGGTNHFLGFSVRVIGLGFEVYIMAVMGMGLVVSILERKYGWDAIRVGSRLMEGRRVGGCVLSGLLVVLTGGIGWRMEKIMMDMIDGQDFEKEGFGKKWTADMVFDEWERVWLLVLHGLVIIWGYVMNTVFYCECRKRQPGREEIEEEGEMDVRIDSNF